MMRKIGRNDSCPCGSGKKYKHCCQLHAGTQTIQPSVEHIAHSQATHSNKPKATMFFHQGNTLMAQGRLDAAIENFNKAIACQSDLAEAHSNLGVALYFQGKLDDAVGHCRQAVSIKPDYTRAYYNLGIGLYAQGEMDEAVNNFRAALALDPDYVEALYDMGNAFQALGKLEEAIASYHKALALKPDFAQAYNNLLFLHSYRASLPPQEYLTLARNWEQACVTAHDRKSARYRTFHRLPITGRRLRVGYVSGDFRQHSISYFIEQLFAHHDRARIELFAYSTNGEQDAVTERLQALVEHWSNLAVDTDTSARERIEADSIDVLIDLSGHTAHNRIGIFANRAAPVQAHYLGYFASTGLTEMDYWIGDEILTPPEINSHFIEQVWRLPRVWVTYKTIADAPEPNWQPAQDGAVWLGSFNNLGKLTPATLALWAKILHALPQGQLLLKTKELANPVNRQSILDTMSSHGISPQRIDLQPATAWADYMACHNRLDIALDPVGGHGGGTSTCDALWMGVPVIHELGSHVGSRFAASMLNAIGHPEWVAHSEAEYVDKVVALARNVEQRKALRPIQRGQMAHSPLCDAKDLATNLENAYFEMFERWLAIQNKRSHINL